MFGHGALLHRGSASRTHPAVLSMLSIGIFPRGCCLTFHCPSQNSPLLLDLPAVLCSAVELCHSHRGVEESGQSLCLHKVHGWAGSWGMDVGLSPFSISLSVLCLMCGCLFYPHVMNPGFNSFHSECSVGHQGLLLWSLPLLLGWS